MHGARFRADPISDSFVRLVDVIFGVIMAQGFVIYRDVITNPTISLASGGLVLAYVTVIMSWIGYHKSVSGYPYNTSAWSRIRLVSDILILVIYAYLVFVGQNIQLVLGGLVVVFVLYMLNGIFRIIEWKDRKVSQPLVSLGFAVEFGMLWYLYMISGTVQSANVTIFVLAFASLLAYRIVRGNLGYPPIIPVGIDVDGVLGEQVPPVLTKLQNKGIGMGYTKEKITHWNEPIDGSSIDKEIEEALLDPAFVREMPLVAGSTSAMAELRKRFHIVITTSRPSETEPDTVNWLNRNFPKSFHEFVNTRLFGKETLGLKVLVDDYPNNIKRFASSGGTALLFSQPWNANEDEELRELIRSGKVIRCKGWDGVKQTLDKLAQRPFV